MPPHYSARDILSIRDQNALRRTSLIAGFEEITVKIIDRCWHIAALAAPHHFGRFWSEAHIGRRWR
jgi:hypothetical protein